ncbi:MAG: malto-oligosyltrehalose trehalohydrolase [Cellvibrio sp. 79]|nr:MAG: malto-oligosyltrehalose trehalohydrolase [Cellvibrio sp. 79]
MHNQRRYPVGAEFTNNGVQFRVWAPRAKTVKIIINNTESAFEMMEEEHGYKSLTIPSAKPGDLYQFKLDDDKNLYPDPASRAQPSGPHGPSMVIDPATFIWTDEEWAGVQHQNNVIYEMHIGTFTRAGTFRAAVSEFKELVKLGVTIIELMPVNEFDGEFGWGYDGVDLYAPYHVYGTPDDLRYFVDEAHAAGLAVILDVVYNHVGSSGCYLTRFSTDYFSNRYKSEWGDTFNFDGKNSAPVREFIINNALYWIEEFHFDGFRVDATQQIFDASDEYILAAIVRQARLIAGKRTLYIAGENEPQNTRLLKPSSENGYGFDALWNDDFHHSARVAGTGRTAAYFSDYKGEMQEFISNLKYGFLYQGQYYQWQKQQRGTPSYGISAKHFIHYLQNHDQIANSGRGKRLHQLTQPALMRALTAILLLGPQTPLIFQGQEFGATTPFLYFADNPEPLAHAVDKGRKEFLHQFPYLAQPEMQSYLSRPDNLATFTQCKLNFYEREKNYEIYQLHKDLLRLRQTDRVFSGQDYDHIDGAIIGQSVFLMRFFSLQQNDDRLLIVNFGRDSDMTSVAEPLFAPHINHDWKLLWSSESPHYGGHGSAAAFSQKGWLIPGFSAAVLTPIAK